MSKHLVIAAAGTGGHVMPGVAVAKILISRGWTVSWIGTEQGMERRIVERQKIPFTALDFQGLRGKGLKTMLFGGFKLLKCIAQSRTILAQKHADAVFSTGGDPAVPVCFDFRKSTGGYIAVPVCLASGLKGIPYVLMNSDADPLLSIKMVQGNAAGVMCGFDGKAAKLAGDKGVVTGNPVRKEILAIPAPEERYQGREGRLKLLIFGGSLGAQVFNQNVPSSIAALPPEKRPEIIHQCGMKAVEEVKASYAALGIEAQVVPFIEDMAAAYVWADVVLARAGAISVSELTAAGVPSILVPLVTKTTSHQVGNAKYMQEAGAAIYLPQSELTTGKLTALLEGLNRKELLEMAKKAKALGKPDAAATVADFIEYVSNKE